MLTLWGRPWQTAPPTTTTTPSPTKTHADTAKVPSPCAPACVGSRKRCLVLMRLDGSRPCADREWRPQCKRHPAATGGRHLYGGSPRRRADPGDPHHRCAARQPPRLRRHDHGSCCGRSSCGWIGTCDTGHRRPGRQRHRRPRRGPRATLPLSVMVARRFDTCIFLFHAPSLSRPPLRLHTRCCSLLLYALLTSRIRSQHT
jgi:hypothetical protein